MPSSRTSSSPSTTRPRQSRTPIVDGELEPPAPKQTGAEGRTFGRDDVDFDPELVTTNVSADLPELSIDAISVYGDGVGATYVLAATSEVGGFLDIVVGPQGQVFSVDPI